MLPEVGIFGVGSKIVARFQVGKVALDIAGSATASWSRQTYIRGHLEVQRVCERWSEFTGRVYELSSRGAYRLNGENKGPPTLRRARKPSAVLFLATIDEHFMSTPEEKIKKNLDVD